MSPDPDSLVEGLERRLRAQERELKALRARVDALEAGRYADDEDDEGLVRRGGDWNW